MNKCMDIVHIYCYFFIDNNKNTKVPVSMAHGVITIILSGNIVNIKVLQEL